MPRKFRGNSARPRELSVLSFLGASRTLERTDIADFDTPSIFNGKLFKNLWM